MLAIENLSKTYVMGDNVVHALRGITLTIEDGDFVAIMGPSGSGKSTLAQILGLLDGPTSGSFKLNGMEVSQLREDELAILRREEIGFVFQQFNLLPRMSAAENVGLPLLYSKKFGEDRAPKLLELVGLGPRRGHRPNELSGGQQQRVAIARALVNEPKIILADEPTGNLDSGSEREILNELRRLNDLGKTILVVTHEEEIGAQAKRLIRLRDGVVTSDERRVPYQKPEALAITATAPPVKHTSIVFDIVEHFRQGLRTLGANKVRTALSMLGILIGVAAVVAMLALGRGAQKAVEEQLSSLGSNLLVLRSGAMRIGGVAQDVGATTRLTPEDAEAIKQRLPAVKAAGGTVSGKVQITYQNKNWSSTAQGVTSSYGPMHNSLAETGRFLSDDDNKNRARVAVIGMTIVRELFGDKNPLGEFIKLNKVSFQVIGILVEKGGNGFRDQDDIVLIPLLTAMHRLLGKDFVDNIDIEIRSAPEVTPAQDDVSELMYSRKRVPPSQRDEAFQIHNMADIQQALASSSKTMAMLLASIAAISLLVGGIGIMNIMLVSVTERTKEIGLRKAVGARRRDILLQFLTEAVVVSAVGGIAGIILGWGSTLLISYVVGWSTSVSLDSVLLAFCFSAFIGIVFGIYPARKASELHPIVALRYE